MSTRQFAALLGLAFTVVWIATGFGQAVLALAVAGVAYAAVAFYEGDLDLAEAQDRLRGERERPPRTDPPRAANRRRVQ